jgi:hypothetical protein
MTIKYIISSKENKGICLNNYELPHFLRHNNLIKEELIISSYCTNTRTYYGRISKPYINTYKGKRGVINPNRIK